MSVDNETMETIAFIDRSYRVLPDGRGVVCDTLAVRGDLDALRDALAWRRASLAVATYEDADAILALREVIALDDQLADAIAGGSPAPLTVTSDRARLLCELAGAYVAERDVAGHQSPEERSRIARLRTLSGRLMDTCCELTAAEAEAREKQLLV